MQELSLLMCITYFISDVCVFVRARVRLLFNAALRSTPAIWRQAVSKRVWFSDWYNEQRSSPKGYHDTPPTKSTCLTTRYFKSPFTTIIGSWGSILTRIPDREYRKCATHAPLTHAELAPSSSLQHPRIRLVHRHSWPIFHSRKPQRNFMNQFDEDVLFNLYDEMLSLLLYLLVINL